MRQKLLLYAASVVALLAAGCTTVTPYDPKAGKPTLFPVADLVSVVSKAIEDTQATIKKTPSLPPLEAVTLTLQTVTGSSGGGGIKFWVVGGSRSVDQSRTETVTIKLTPPDPDAASSVSGTDAVYEKLKESILRVADAARDAESGSSGVLEMASIGTELAFSLKTSSEGTLGFKIEPIDLSAKGAFTDQAIHKIGVSFARKKAK
jgi:hypothetical protein